MNIIFMGTPNFAVPTLQKLILAPEHQLKAVFTQRPKAQGRGLQITKSPIQQLAEQYDIPVFTPKTLRTPEAVELIESIEADIIIVVAYGFIIPANILQTKKYGCLNIHPSKLPQYRGAAPLQRIIMNGESESAVCIIKMDEGVDTGDILLQQNISLDKQITLTSLHDQCAELGGNLLIKTLTSLPGITKLKQSTNNISYAEKLSKTESLINWHDTAFKIDCMIRGMNPWPGVHFEYKGKKVKILKATYKQEEHDQLPGTILNKSFEISCGAGILQPILLKAEGKGELGADAYLNGNQQLNVGDNLS